MKFYKKGKSEDKLICTLCQHYCNISVGKTGICGVNKNTGDKIETLVYGYPAALHIDPIEKKPLYHFLPNTKTLSLGTVGCNFKCSFCQNHSISQEKKINKERYYSSEDIIKLALENQCESISYTYNEPTIFYPYVKDIATLAKQNGLKNVMVTNGFESDEVINDMVGLIDAVNVDYKSNDPHYYKQELGGDLETLKRNLKRFKELGIWIEITTLIIPDLNDGDEELEAIARFIYDQLGKNTPWHLSAFHPDYKMLDKQRTPGDTLQRGYNIGKKVGLNYLYMGNSGEKNTTRCPYCDEVILERINFQTIKDNRKLGVLCPKCHKEVEGVYYSRRDASVKDSFYSSSCEEIKEQFDYFNHLLQTSNFTSFCHIYPRAIIVPHAGYVYSGFTANVAYQVAKSDQYKRIIVIGPSHKFAFDGASVSLFDRYETSCKDMIIDKRYAKYLKEKFDFIEFYDGVHCEHSTETQVPFIEENFPQSQLIEIVYGNLDYIDLALVLEEIFKDKNNFVVISTDLSHFYTQEKANTLDKICIEAIKQKDLNIWNQGCEACGKVGVKALLEISKAYNWETNLLDYRTSADVTKDDSRVVGYLSAVVGELKS